MKTKKTLAILLSVMMILSVVPMFASAAELIVPVISVVPVASAVEANSTLRKSTLSGGVAIDPNTGEEVSGDWVWDRRSTVVTKNGYFLGYFVADNSSVYDNDPVFFYALVNVIGDTSEPEIPEDMVITGKINSWPTIAETEWKVGMTVADLTLAGGEATVAGKFSILTSADTLVVPGENSVRLEFTPDNPKVEMLSSTIKAIEYKVAVTTEDFTATIDPAFVYTYEYGSKYLGKINGDPSIFGIATDIPSDIKVTAGIASAVDKDGNPVDTQEYYLAPGEYTARVFLSVEPINVDGIGKIQFYNSPKFIDNIPLVITRKTSTSDFGILDITGTTNGEGQSTASIYYKFHNTKGVNGHCVLKVNGETVVDNIVPTATTYSFVTDTSGKFTATLEYIPAETDYVEFTGTLLTEEFELDVLEPENPIIPGGDDEGDENENPDFDLDLDFDGSHKFDFVNLIQNLIAKLKAFIQQIGDFFSNMSLEGLGNITG